MSFRVTYRAAAGNWHRGPTRFFWHLPVLLLLTCEVWGGDAVDTGQQPGTVLLETGATCEALASFDELMRTFVKENALAGASLAVTKDGRLVYARGFGFSDVERWESVQPDSLFRLASLSKPITAVAVLQLVDQRRLGLDDCVCDRLKHEARLRPGELVDPRWRKVTIRQLLQHRGGWDRDKSIDPMFRSLEIAAALGSTPPASPDDIISYMLGQPLDFEPGARYAYSNFGYCLLGRVIEQVTGTAYESAVQRQLLEPLGIHRMGIGHSLLEQRQPGEVRYYTVGHETAASVVRSAESGTPSPVQVPIQYGAWYLEAMDAHGGWIGSAVDMVRFVSQVQRHDRVGLLSKGLFDEMIACPPGDAGHDGQGAPRDSYYGLGWLVRPVDTGAAPSGYGGCNFWHAGGLPGTSTLLVARHDGLCWAVLFNTTFTSDGIRPAAKIDPLMHGAANAVREWPGHDLFPDYLQ